MKKNKKAHSIFIIMAFVIAFACSCGQKENVSTDINNNSNDSCIYEFTDLGFNLAANADYSYINCDKDGIYGLKKSNSDGHINYSFMRLKSGQTKPEETLIGSGNLNFENLITGNDGCFYVIRTLYPDKKAIQDMTDEDDFPEEGEKKLVKYSPSGDEIWETVLLNSDEYVHIKEMAYVKNKGVLIYTSKGFTLYDETSGIGKYIDVEDQGDFHDDRILLTNADGRIFVCETDNKWRIVLYEFDTKKFALKNKVYVPNEVYSSALLYTGVTNDFYYVDDKYIYSFNYGDNKLKKICSFIDSGFYSDNTLLFYETSSDNYRIIATYKVGDGKIFSMTKKNAQVDGKTIITIGTAFTDEYIKKRIIEFNQNSEKYLIRVKDYSETGYSSYYSIYKAMNEDIESENAPDIMVLNSYSATDSYISKGLLEPLDSYIENDRDIQEKDYLENIKSLSKRNGIIYTLIPYFSVDTCAASKEYLNDETVTLSNYINLCNKHNVKVQYMMGDIYFSGVDDFYTTSGFDFIDFENNTCDFKNYKFINLLIYLREIKKLEDNKGTRIDENCFRNNKAFLLPFFISSFEDYKIIKDGYFGTEIKFNGYPSIEGGSSYINPIMMFAISSSSENKDACWEFIRYFLLDEYQYSINWGFPVNEKAFDSLMEASQKEKYYVDENGKKINTNSKIVVGNKEVYITPLTTKEAEEFKSFICGIDKLRHQDTELIGIISESARPYFNGEITAEKASSLVQHRVEKYLNEK